MYYAFGNSASRCYRAPDCDRYPNSLYAGTSAAHGWVSWRWVPWWFPRRDGRVSWHGFPWGLPPRWLPSPRVLSAVRDRVWLRRAVRSLWPACVLLPPATAAGLLLAGGLLSAAVLCAAGACGLCRAPGLCAASTLPSSGRASSGLPLRLTV